MSKPDKPDKSGKFGKSKDKYPRFDRGQRLEHTLLIISFTTLAISGLPQKYPDTAWGDLLIRLMGGIEFTRQIHHLVAIMLMLEIVYHGVIVAYKTLVLRLPLTMLPGWKDLKDGWQALLYNVGLMKRPPRMGRYTFGEKIEYWAVVWGTVIMVITGFILWNPILAVQFLPGQFIPAAKAAHGGEALLAVLAIITWHVYHVHLKHFNKSMFTGYLSRHEMEAEHQLELTEFESGPANPAIDPLILRRRQRVFIPVAAVISVVLLAGLYVFITFEQTAITTVPRQERDVFAPATPTPDG